VDARLVGIVGAPDFILPWLERIYDEDGAYTPAALHDHLEVRAIFEGRKDVPPGAHRRLAPREVDDRSASVRPTLEPSRDGGPVESGVTGCAYLLLDEAEAVVVAEPPAAAAMPSPDASA
jgi:hypothetical protein